jgi:hypothetical protein
MKISFAIIAAILLSFGMQVMAGGKTISYVKTGDKVYLGEDLKMGVFNSKIISSDGTVTKIPHRDVVSYMHDSRLFEYLPVVCESDDTLCFAMMEYLTTRSGLRLYRYSCYDEKETKYQYFVFKDGKFYLHINQKNALTTLPFFGINDVQLANS